MSASIPMTEIPHHMIELGPKLKHPPEALCQRINLLDAVEGLISRQEQSPPYPVSHALLHIKEGLVGERFFGSCDIGVKISSLSCIHELMRISAPDQSYDDDRMKEIFKETVKAFEHLSSGSGRFFQKARSMLYNVANVMSALILLDLECESLVAQMFQIFLRDTRSDYPAEVVSDMESLMTRLIKEADELSVDMLRPLVMSVGAENQLKSPPSAKLGMKVLQNCSTIVQPYLQTVIDHLQRDLDSCSRAVASLCPGHNVRQRRLPRQLVADYVIPESPRRRKRERHTRSNEENEAREELVGSRIKVWWPSDKVYYEGTVSSYNPARKRHRVVYADGYVESLRLSQEPWSLVHGTSTVQEPNHPGASSSHVPVDELRKRILETRENKRRKMGQVHQPKGSVD